MNNHLLQELSSVERFQALMQDLGFKQCLSPAVLGAAMDLHEGRLPRGDLLQEARNFFDQRAIVVPEGLEGLPAIWLSRLSAIVWHTRQAEWEIVPYFMTAVELENGILRIRFPQEHWDMSDKIALWDQLRVVLNLSLTPNYWRPLSKADERELWDKRPDLRGELFTVGWPSAARAANPEKRRD